MNVTAQEIMHDLITRPGLGMFAWMCFVFFVVAIIFFIWAIRSGQFNDLEKSKFDLFDEGIEKEVPNDG